MQPGSHLLQAIVTLLAYSWLSAGAAAPAPYPAKPVPVMLPLQAGSVSDLAVRLVVERTAVQAVQEDPALAGRFATGGLDMWNLSAGRLTAVICDKRALGQSGHNSEYQHRVAIGSVHPACCGGFAIRIPVSGAGA